MRGNKVYRGRGAAGPAGAKQMPAGQGSFSARKGAPALLRAYKAYLKHKVGDDVYYVYASLQLLADSIGDVMKVLDSVDSEELLKYWKEKLAGELEYDIEWLWELVDVVKKIWEVIG